MVALGLVLLTVVRPPEPSPFEIVAYGRQLDVTEIDSRLVSERYDAWLARTLGPEATITWESNGCGEEGHGYGDIPACVRAEAKLRPRGRVVISIRVGSFRGGLGGIPDITFGMIEGLGPREPIEQGDLPFLASKILTAQEAGAELSRLPDVPPDEDAWIRQVQRMPAAQLVPRGSGNAAFVDWVAARAGPRAKLEWFVEGCRRRGPGGPRVDLTGDKDEWAYVDVEFEDPDVQVLTRVRVGTCRKGMWRKPVAAPVRLRHKPARYGDTEAVSIDVLEAKLKAIRRRQSAQPPVKQLPHSM